MAKKKSVSESGDLPEEKPKKRSTTICREPKMISFSRYVKAKIAETNFKRYTPFCDNYESWGLTPSVIGEYLRRLRLPKAIVVESLARALSHATGEQITPLYLWSLIYPHTENENLAEPPQGPIELTGEELFEDYTELVFDDRCKIAPDFLEQIRRDFEQAVDAAGDSLTLDSQDRESVKQVVKDYENRKLAIRCKIALEMLDHFQRVDFRLVTGDAAEVLSTLVRDEIKRSNGRSKLEERYGLDSELLGALRDKEDVRLTLPEIRKIADNIRDENVEYGNLDRFLTLAGFPMNVTEFIEQWMAKKGASTVEEMADLLIEASKSTLNEVDRKDFIETLQDALDRNELPTNDNKWYSRLVPVLAKEVGFADESALEAYLQEKSG